MYEVYFMTWAGREEEAEKICETLEEAIAYCEAMIETEPLSSEEGYIILKGKKTVWQG